MQQARWIVAAVMGLLATAVMAAEVQGVVNQVVGLRVTVTDGQGRPVTLSVPAGTVLKPGDRVRLQTAMVGDTLRASAVTIQKP